MTIHSERSNPSRTDHRSRRIYEEQPGKLPELAGCPRCGASYREGRWTGQTAPVGSYEHVCPACQRIEQDDPAGVFRVEGQFVSAHRDEIVGLLHNVEARERAEHPLKRIMAIRDLDAPGPGLEVTVTDGKLVEALGHALAHAYRGEVELPATRIEPGDLVRGRWHRD